MAEDTTTKAEAPATGSGAGQEIFLGLLWLGTSMYTAHAEIKGTAGGLTGVLGSAAAALPGLIAATLVASLTIGNAAGSRFRGAGRRLGVGLGVGILFGSVAAAGIRFGYGNESSITVLAVVVGLAGVVGGLATALPSAVIDAALWATTWVFFAGVIFGVLQPNLTKLLGGGPTANPAAQATANTMFTWGQTVLTGLIAGVYASRNLRGDKPGWPWFVVAGALPGVFLLVSEALGRLGGASVTKFVHGFNTGEPALVQLSDSARLRYALIVLAVGAVMAALAGARALARSDGES